MVPSFPVKSEVKKGFLLLENSVGSCEIPRRVKVGWVSIELGTVAFGAEEDDVAGYESSSEPKWNMVIEF
jgi:hypothetical protein